MYWCNKINTDLGDCIDIIYISHFPKCHALLAHYSNLCCCLFLPHTAASFNTCNAGHL